MKFEIKEQLFKLTEIVKNLLGNPQEPPWFIYMIEIKPHKFASIQISWPINPTYFSSTTLYILKLY